MNKPSILQGRKILLGVSSSVACFKSVELCSRLLKEGCEVQVIMTPNATNFIRPLQFEALTQKAVYYDMFAEPRSWEMEHISFARWADAFLIAPATAHTIARMANGLADDPLSCTFLAFEGPTFLAPAMNRAMWTHNATQRNIRRLSKYGVRIVMPESGRLACGETGIGRLAELDRIMEELESFFKFRSNFKGKKILITSGPTQEYLDPARYISNPSSGKMGVALACESVLSGAEVVVISGPCSEVFPESVQVHYVKTATEMHEAVKKEIRNSNICIFAAAVCDFKPREYSTQKTKKEKVRNLVLELERNPDIAAIMGKTKKKNQFFVGFAAETENLIEEGNRKLSEKNLDLLISNPISGSRSAFGSETNQGYLIFKNGKSEEIPEMSKRQMARVILSKISNLMSSGKK